MAVITDLVEVWDGAAPPAAITTSNTKADTLSGTGASVFSNVRTYNGHNGCRFTTTAANRIAAFAHAAAGGWRSFAVSVEVTPAANQTLFYTEGAAVKAGDLRLTTSRTLQVRDAGSVARWTSTAVLTVGTVYWVALRVDSAANGGWRCKIYDGTSGALLDDSGALTNAGFSVAACDEVRLGAQITGDADIWFGETSGDTTTEITPPVTGGAPTLTWTNTRKHVVDATGSTGTVTLTQLSGPTAVSVVESPTKVFTVTCPVDAGDMTFRLRATIGGTNTDETVVLPRHQARNFRVSKGAGVWA